MSRLFIIIFTILFSGCQIFKMGSSLSKRSLKTLSVYANISLESNLIVGPKFKSRINFFKDSIILSASPGLGIELARVKITDERVYIDQKIQNKLDTINIVELDPYFKLKNLKKLFISKREPKDTMAYYNSYMIVTFTNYIKKDNIFLPQKVIIDSNEKNTGFPFQNTLEIQYKKINI
ncbi:MAG: hypothetical protein CMD26_00470 [Flavobacteriales bacterium]|nr:hypothetical protein [Flavobacteriales bacterium]